MHAYCKPVTKINVISSVSDMALDYGLDDRGLESWQGVGIFLFTTASRLALGRTKPPIQWVPEALSLGVKWPLREADHSPPSSAEIKNAWSYPSTTPLRLHGSVLCQSTGTTLLYLHIVHRRNM